MGEAKLNLTGDAAAKQVEAEIRDIVRTKNVHDRLPGLGSDILKAGEGSIAEMDKLMVEIQAARDYLQAEGERVRQMADRYGHLTRTASESVRVITESMGKWRNPELAVSPANSAKAKEPQTSIWPDDGSKQENTSAQGDRATFLSDDTMRVAKAIASIPEQARKGTELKASL